MYQLVKSALLPPMPYLAVAFLGLLLTRRRGDGGWWLAFAAVATLLLLSIPLTSAFLLKPLQRHAPLLSAATLPSAQAIVVLGADDDAGPEYGGEGIGPLTLVRLRYGARLQAATGLPLLVSGGALAGSAQPLAAGMKHALEDEFHIPVAWSEDRSLDTRENAEYSARILRRQGIGRVFLVTHAWHMARARAAFARAGIETVAAPTGFARLSDSGPWMLMPSAKALEASHFAIYEMLGGLYYDLVHKRQE